MTPATIYGAYHSHKHVFQFWPHRAKNDSTVPLGVELEMQFNKYDTVQFNPPHEAWALYQHQITANPDWNLFYFESDGSIGASGIEMITQPMSRHLNRDFWKLMLPKIRENFQGWNTEKFAQDAPYGIHITFEIAEWGSFHLGRLIKFVENVKNQVFMQAIAQRGQLYNNPAGIGSKDKRISEVAVVENGKFTGSQARAQAINVKNNKLCEIRMFRSTLNHVSFMKNLEFLYAFHDWCSCSPFSSEAGVFMNWLIQHAASRYPKYPNLYKYLCRDQFPVKLARYPTQNQCQPLFEPVVNMYRKGQKDLFNSTIILPSEDYTCA